MAKEIDLRAHDHNFRRFNERSRRLSFFQTHFARGVCRNNRRYALPADHELHLSKKSAVPDLNDLPDDLIADADTSEIAPTRKHIVCPRERQKSIDLRSGDAMMPTSGLNAVQFFLVNPLL